MPLFVRAVSLLGTLALLAGLGIYLWAVVMVRGQWEPFSPHLVILSLVLVQLFLACSTLVGAYQTRSAPFPRPRHALPWLESWRGQLMGSVVLVLLSSTNLPLFLWAAILYGLSGLTWVAVSTWLSVWL